jgi:hypothetical protein
MQYQQLPIKGRTVTNKLLDALKLFVKEAHFDRQGGWKQRRSHVPSERRIVAVSSSDGRTGLLYAIPTYCRIAVDIERPSRRR